MGRQCKFCKKSALLNPHLSFHRFPKNPERRKVWFSILGMEDLENFPKYAEICSDHFNSSDIITKPNGNRYLKADSVPDLNAPIFPDPSCSSGGSTASVSSPSAWSPPRSSGINDTESMVQDDPINVAGPSKLASFKEESEEEINYFSSSATLSASETEKLERLATKEAFEGTEQIYSSSSIATSEELSKREIILKSKTGNKGKPLKKRKRPYVGDMTSSDFSTPRKRRKNIKVVKKTVVSQRRKIHNLQMTVRRLKIKIKTLKDLLKYLKEKSLITETSESAIKASVSGPALDVFERMLKGPTKEKYNPTLRSFALTLAFYSPKAYNFVRNTFNRTLPHLGTISRWYRSVDGSPGFTKEALTALTLRQNLSSSQLVCNLVMDEMSIRRQVEWTGKKFTGYVDVGTNIDGDTLPEAREVLVFMLVCLNGSWKVPIGYFLLDGLSSTEKAGLVKKCLQFIFESGVLVNSFTFDGAAVNLAMAEKLGADFTDPLNLKTWFDHPISNEPVYIFLDACHMIKLVRNCMASQTGIRDGDKREVKWNFLTKLVENQNAEGLHAATKLRMRHLQWQREKMKVRLATQTLSRSVSDAISYFREDLKAPDFQNSEGTSNFLLHFNNVFDILNSRNRFAKYFYKKPLSPTTETPFFEYFENIIKYIYDLTLNDRPILRSSRKTGFFGFLICMKSLQKMYKYLVTEKKLLKYILTYKLSQDHLELFFGAIRSKGGYNNNPTARQFEAAYKRLLVKSEISGPSSGNAVNLEQITILTCGSSNNITNTDTGENLEESQEYLTFIQKVNNDIEESYVGSNAWDLTLYVEDVVAYIAGFVVRGLKKCINCPKCLYLLESDSSSSLLQTRKTYGRLIKANRLVIETCRAAEKFFRFFHKTQNIYNKKIKNLSEILVTKTLQNLPVSVFDLFGDHMFDHETLNEHPIQMLKLILKSYFKIRIHYETMKSLDLTKKNRSRSINTKTVLFRNE